MPQDMNPNPEGDLLFEEGQVSVEQVPDAERREAPAGPERAKERASETAHEKYRDILAKVSPKRKSVSDDDDDTVVDVDAQSVYSELDAESRVSKLLSLAESKSPEYAVRVAMKLNDFYVLDRMHDEMAEKFYDALVKKGVIKQ